MFSPHARSPQATRTSHTRRGLEILLQRSENILTDDHEPMLLPDGHNAGRVRNTALDHIQHSYEYELRARQRENISASAIWRHQ